LPVVPPPPPFLPLPVALAWPGSSGHVPWMALRSSAPMRSRLRRFWNSCGRAVGRSGIGFVRLFYPRVLASGSFASACVRHMWPLAVWPRSCCGSRPRACPRRSWKGRRKCCRSRAWWPLPVLGTGRHSRLRRSCVPCSRLAVLFVLAVLAAWMLPCVPSHPMPSHSRLKTFLVWPLFNSRHALGRSWLALRRSHCFRLGLVCSGRGHRWRSSVR
jgi:hypothetical protein